MKLNSVILSWCFQAKTRLYLNKGWRGARIAQELPSKNWNQRSINYLIKKIEETGSTDRKYGSGKPKTAQTERNIRLVVEESIMSQEENPGTHTSQRKLGKRLNISQSSVLRIARKLKIKAFKRIQVSRRGPAVREKRRQRCRRLLDNYTSAQTKRIIFTDEKDFTLEIPRNRQNDRVYSRGLKRNIHPSRLYHEQCRFSSKVMVSAGVSWNGPTSIHFIDGTMNSTAYISLLRDKLLPDCIKLYPRKNFIFQQDGATCHTSHQSQDFLRENAPHFIKKLD